MNGIPGATDDIPFRKDTWLMKYDFLTGSYAGRDETGIHRVCFDPAAGFCVLASVKGLENPSYVLAHPNGRAFYAVEETGEGRVREGRLDGDMPLSPVIFPTEGASPCHLALSEDLRYLYAANYSGGSLAAFAMDEAGGITGRTDVRRHVGAGPNAARQEAAHVHFSMALEGLVYVCDLGMDAIVIYQNDAGHLMEAGRVAMPAGSGPRHLAHSGRHPGWLYCVAELDSRVYALRRAADGWSVDHAASILPQVFAGENIAAAIRVTDDGKLLLASNRGHDSIAVIPLGPDGRLGEPVISPCVAEPRDFVVCGDCVLAASQRDSVIRAYRLNRETLRLEDTGMGLEICHPVCLCPLK